MKKWNICKLAVILILSTQNNAVAQRLELTKTTVLEIFPSASSLEFYNNRLYVIGDDAKNMLVLNNQHQVVDSVALFQSNEYRINKDDKADLESSVLLRHSDKNYLIAFSSLSTKTRNKLLVFDVEKNKAVVKAFTLSNTNLPEMNIEGATLVNDILLMSNRANNTNKTNHLIVTKFDGEDAINEKDLKTIAIHLPRSKNVEGISGLTYVQEMDLLLFTASTESTDNAYTDGAIGDSFIGYIPGISKKLHQKEIVVDKLISLKKFFPKTPEKIESIVVETYTKNNLVIHLAADNDNGKSTLFKMNLTLNELN